MANNKWDPSASTSEDRPQQIKRLPEPGLSKVEVVMMVSHLMEHKRDIAILGGSKYLARWNNDKIGKLKSAQPVRKQQIESK